MSYDPNDAAMDDMCERIAAPVGLAIFFTTTGH
jgi:hypothetical protein